MTDCQEEADSLEKRIKLIDEEISIKKQVHDNFFLILTLIEVVTKAGLTVTY